MGEYALDPYGFVLYAFPWGEGDLVNARIEDWQKELLCDMRDWLESGLSLTEVFQRLRSSGHGIGKSALVAWVVLWAMSTRENTRGVVTANTEPQLRTKTWPELHKWYRRCITRHWFNLTATSIHHVNPLFEKTWRMDIIPWDENNTEAFAGLHNKGNRIVAIYDEASGIHDRIWEVSEGALTDANTERIWLAFGNPTRNTGRFHDNFIQFRHRWKPKSIDSRDVSITDKTQLDKWKVDYGEDSDFFRVRVRGLFPKQEADTLIPLDWLEAAKERKVLAQGPKTLSVDVARYGDDDSVICPRDGRQVRELVYIHGSNTMEVTGRVVLMYRDWGATDINVDEIGMGAGVLDRLDELKLNAHGFNGSEKPFDEERFSNKRSEAWWSARVSLDPTGPAPMAIPNDDRLCGDLAAPKWTVDSAGRIVVEAKEKTKKRLGRSPDAGDAYVMAVYKSYCENARPAMAFDNRFGLRGRPSWL